MYKPIPRYKSIIRYTFIMRILIYTLVRYYFHYIFHQVRYIYMNTHIIYDKHIDPHTNIATFK